MRLAIALLLGGATLGVAGCGVTSSGAAGSSVAGSATPTASPSSPAPSPSSGPVLGTASNAAGWTAVVTAGSNGELQLSLTVTGPLTVVGGCVSTLTAWAETTSGARVPTPTLSPIAHCLAIAIESVPAGTSRTFTASLPDPPQPGTYTVQGSLDTEGGAAPAVPVVTISI